MWRNLFTVSWKNEVFQCTVDENKIDICACTGVIFAISKKVCIFICIKTCHMMKKVVKQLGLRITEH